MLRWMITQPNIELLTGNHEQMMLSCAFMLENPPEGGTESLNGKTAYRYGVLTLARDEQKEPDAVLSEPLVLSGKPDERAAPEAGETVRFLLEKQGGGHAVLTDYASCGKHWDKPNAAVSVWQELAE